jgi:hypothetical protein
MPPFRLGNQLQDAAMTPDEVRETARLVMTTHGSKARAFAELTAAFLIRDGLDDVGQSWRCVADVIRRREEGLVKSNPLV